MLETIFKIIKFPLFEVFKLFVITPLNLFPIGVVEIFAINDTENQRPDLRELKTNIKGSRRLHLGCTLIAYLRGAIVNKSCGGNVKVRGVYREDFEDIRKKWTY